MESSLMEKIVALCKRRGFIYPGSEIYGGITGFWDYGPLGVELKNNIKREWWKSMVYQRDDVVGLDAAIIMNPQVWKASGHLEAFTDPLAECKYCHNRFRVDQLLNKYKDEAIEFPGFPKGTIFNFDEASARKFIGSFLNDRVLCPICKKKSWTEPRMFNLLAEIFLGITEPKQKAYLRGEITQGVFVNFENIVNSSRVRVPFGIAQVGKAFRNEITPGNFTFRSREFEQMELEFFIKPEDRNEKRKAKSEKYEDEKWFEYWKDQRLKWYLSLGMKKENLRLRRHEDKERAHYAREAEDIEYNAPFGWSEFEGIHHRGDWDLSRHKLKYIDDGKEFTPCVIETSGGVDRSALFFLIDAYHEDEKRIVLKLHPKLSPIKAAVFPLLTNKLPLVKLAKEIYADLKAEIEGLVVFDDRGNIGKRYYSQDEIGTPFCVTIDFQSLEDKTVTIRDRDTMKQERVKIKELNNFLKRKL